MNRREQFIDKKKLLFYLAFIYSLTLISGLILILSIFLPKDTGLVPDLLKSQFLNFLTDSLRPEPNERYTYILTTLLSPFIVLFSIFFADKSLTTALKAKIPIIQILLGIILIVCFSSLFYFPIINAVLGLAPGTFLVQWASIAISLTLIIYSLKQCKQCKYLVLDQNFFLIIALFFTCLGSIWRVFSIGSVTFTESALMQHFNAVLYAQSQASTGKLLFLDYTSQYGFFVEILSPWFKLIGLSVLTFTATMTALHAVATISILYFLAKHIQNMILFFLAAASIILFNSIWITASYSFEPYFQYSTIRLLCPAIALNLFDIWARRRSYWLAIGISFFCGFALIWNIDSGFAVAGTWIVLQLVDFFRPPQKRALIHFSLSVVGIALSLFIFYLHIYLKSGHWISLDEITRSQRIFYIAGFFMLPIPTYLHLWMYVICIYIGGIILGIGLIQGKFTEEKLYPIFYTSILGIGLFSYYQGRSHDYSLTYVIWPAILILAILSQKTLDSLTKHHVKLSPELLFLVMTTSLGIMASIRIYQVMPIMFAYTQDHIDRIEIPKSSAAENSKFIAESLSGKRECAIFADNQAVYFAENNLASSIAGPGLMEVLLKSDLHAINSQFTHTPPSDLIVAENYLEISEGEEDFFHFKGLISDKYTLVSTSQNKELSYYKRETGNP